MFVEVYQWYFFFLTSSWTSEVTWQDGLTWSRGQSVNESVSFPEGRRSFQGSTLLRFWIFVFFFLHYLLEENHFLTAWLGLDVSRAGSKFMFLFVQFIFMKHHQTSVSTGWRFLVVWNCHLIFRNTVEADEIFLLFTVYTVNQCGLNLNWSPVFATKGQLFSQGCWLKNSILCTIQESFVFFLARETPFLSFVLQYVHLTVVILRQWFSKWGSGLP